MLDKVFKHRVFPYIYTPLLFALGCLVVLRNEEVNGVILFGYITAATLLLSSRFTDAMLPALLLSVFVTRCYNSADIFMAKIPYFIPIVVAVLAHFLIYRNIYIRAPRIGRSFFGLCGVALAVTLGGLGTIPASDYFAGGALFYVFGLGVGMVVFYLLIKANFTEDSGREVVRTMYIVGLFACFCVLRFYAADWETVLETKQFLEFQSSNNLATFLMLAMPFPLFYASRRFVDVVSFVFIYVCTVLTGSRGGLLLGSVEFVVILLAFAVFNKQHIINRVLYILMAIGFVVTAIRLLPQVAAFFDISVAAEDGSFSLADCFPQFKEYFLRDGETRLRLLTRVWGDFQTNPIFGVGIGYTGNADLYNPVKGAMNWYHMWFAQVIGGLGIVGILAYGYQLTGRIVLFFKNRTLINFTFLMSYLGLFLMSQVNPGEFCPVPYAALAVTYFALMEKEHIKLNGCRHRFNNAQKH